MQSIYFKELLMRIELTTSSLPRKCSTPELQQLKKALRLMDVRNRRYVAHSHLQPYFERKTRIEPATYSLEGYRSTN
jgi:hypothetical protein